MVSKAGPFFSIIAGIINFIFAALSVLLLFFLRKGITLTGGSSSGGGIFVLALILIFGVPNLISGLLFLLSVKWMKDDKKAKRGGILSLILGIVNLPFFVIGGLFGIVGGAIAIVTASK